MSLDPVSGAILIYVVAKIFYLSMCEALPYLTDTQ